MDVFSLFAKIGIDTSEYDKGLDGASGKASSFGDKLKSGFSAIAKFSAAALGAATAAVTAFAKSSIDTGMQFDSSMSQVAATMGTTVDQIQELRDFAMDMGAKTAFSATQTADALNYMALAGYNSEQAMQALPNVLNLAAAGGIDLAAASDMVTDAQSALGLSMEESAALVDKMAMASSKSNTSVSQLGEAILTIGGTAKNLAGGTTELSTALGILADNGIKGAEGGTALRNIILSLSAPTDKAAKLMASLGLEVYDADGKMRPLNETFGDLQTVLSTMTQGDQTQVLSEIFNKVDLKSVNALLANTGARFDELSGYIDNATGAAERMAATQLDNLAGDVTLFKSALEGAQIVLSDQLTPSLRGFVQFGSSAISTLSDAFKEGGLSGAMGALGTILSDGLNMVIEQVPVMVQAGMQLLGALGQGLLDNLPVITDAALQVVIMLANGLILALPQIASGAAEIITTLANGLAEQLPTLVPIAVEAVLQLVETLTSPDSLNSILDAAINLIASLGQGILDSLPSIVDATVQIVVNIVETIMNVDWIQLGFDILQFIVDGIVSLFGALLDIAFQLVDILVDTIGQANWLQVGASILEFIITGIVSLLGSLLSLAGRLVSTLWDKITNAKWFQLGVDVLKNIINGIRNIFTSLGTAAKDIVSKIGDTIINTDWLGIGRNIISGIVNGIGSAAGMLIQAARNVASGALNAIKSFFGIASPSKVMAKEVGRWLPPGIGVGVEDAMPQLLTDIKKQMLGVVDTANAELSDFEIGSFGVAAMTSLPTAYVPQSEAAAYRSGTSSGGGVVVNQTIYAAEQSPIELAANTRAAFQRARWAIA